MTRLLPLLAAVAAVTVLLLPGGVRAQSVDPVLVSNTGQTAGDDLATADGREILAQSFTTGNHVDGYFLSSVEVGLKADSGATVEVSLWWSDSQYALPPRGTYYYPGIRLAKLSGVSDIDNDASTLERFHANDVLLLPGRTYWIVVTSTGGAVDGLSVATTVSEDSVDAGGMDGFFLGNNIWVGDVGEFLRNTIGYENPQPEPWSDYSGSADVNMKIRLRGSEATRPPGPYVTNRNQQPRGEPVETSTSTSAYATSFYIQSPFFGSGATSYVLTSVLLGVAAETGVTPRVAIYADNGNKPAANPLTNGTLTAPADISTDLTAPGRAEFTASTALSLARNTTYWVVLDIGSGSGKLSVSTTKSDFSDEIRYGEVVADDYDWSIGETMRAYIGSSWSWDSGRRSFRMAINGTTDPYAPATVDFGLPQVGVALTPRIEDKSARYYNESWQWQRGETSEGPFTDISAEQGGTTRFYTPSTADLGKWLKATVSYSNAFGPGKSASGISPQVVLSRPVISNAGRTGVLTYSLEDESGVATEVAEAFTTGSDATGYLLRGLRIATEFDPYDAGALVWALHADDAGQPAATPLFERIPVPLQMLDSDAGTFEELVHPGFKLDPETTYWVVLRVTPLPQVTVRFGADSYEVDEDGSVHVTVSLSAAPGRRVEIPITATNQGDTSDADYSPVPDSVTFEAGDTEKSFTFTPFDDDLNDDGESVRLAFGYMPDARISPWPEDATTVTIADNDDPEVEVSFASATYTAAEGATASVTVTLSEDPERTVEIPLTKANQGTTSNDDYSVPTSVTFNSGETSKTLAFTANADEAEDDGESVLIGFGTPPDGVTVGAPDTATVSIYAAPVTVSFGAETYSASEGGGVTVTVQLSGDPGSNVTVPIFAMNQGGASASDYSGVPDRVTFGSGVTSRSFTVSATDDHLTESEEEVKLTLGPAPSGIALGSHAEATISLNDGTAESPPTVHFGASSYSVEEGGSVDVTVTLDKAPGSDAVVPITATSQGGAGDLDYSGVPDNVTFGPEETEKTFTFIAAQDSVNDDGEAVLLAFGTLTDGITVTADQATSTTVSITDDDEPRASGTLLTLDALAEFGHQAVFRGTVPELDAGSESDWRLHYLTRARLGTSTEWVYFTEALELSGKSVLRMSILTYPEVKASLAVESDTVDEGDTATVTVTLDKDPERTVVIPIATSHQDGASNDDYSIPTTVTFESGDTEKTITFTAEQDDIDDDGESVTLGFGDLPPSVSEGETTEATVSITDDDTAGVTVSKNSLEIEEGSSDTYTVVLDTEPTADVTVDALGFGGSDLTVNPQSLRFTADNWDSPRTVTVTVRHDQDSVDDDDVTITHRTNSTDPNYHNATVGSVVVTTTDNDKPGVEVTFGSSTYTAAEGGDVSITVTLDRAPERSLSIPIDPTNQGTTTDADYMVPTSVTFNSTETSRTITFTANQDTENDDNESVLLDFGELPDGVTEGTPSSTTVSITDDDHPQVEVTFGSSNYTAAEGGTVSIVVELDKAPERSLTIPVRSTNQGTTTNADYDVPTSITFNSAETSKSITFTANQDTEDDDNESVLLDFGTLPTGVTEGTPSSTTVSITDDDHPQVEVTFGSSTYTADEGDSVSITVTLDKQPERTITIPVRSTNQGTTSNGDYSVPTSVTFNSTETSRTITFTANQDTEDDDNESVLLDFGTPPTGVTEGTPSSTTVSITDDDHPQVEVRFGSSTYTADEGDSVSITVTLDKQPERSVTIPIDRTNQGTTTNADYSMPTSVTFNSAETSRTITFTAEQDDIDDDGESVLLAFGVLPTGVSEGSPSSTTVSITDDDGTPTAITLSVIPASIGEADGETDVTVTATLVGSSTRTTATTVTLSLSGTAADPGDYAVTTALTSVTIPAGQSSGSGTLTVTPVADAVVEGDETVVVDGAAVGFTVSSATITMEDDDEATLSISGPSSDVSEGADATFTVTLSHAVDESVQVAWSAPGTGDTAVAGDLDSTSGSVTFPANSAAGATRTITIRAVDDMLSEQAETFTVTLGTITSGRSDRVSLATGAASASATIAESDPVTVQISGPATVAEGGQATYTVSLSPSGVTPTADLTVDYATVDGTATAGSDYTQKSGTLTFTQASPGEQTFTVQTLQDSLDDDDETFTASISNPQGGGGPTPTLSATDSSVTTTITDDDHPQVKVAFGSSTYTAAEGDDVSITVTLDKQPERTVTIPVRSTNQGTTSNGDYSVPTSVTFGSAETSKTITFTANQDTEDDDNESVLLDFGTLPTGVTEGTPSSTTVSITDDDVPQVKVSFGSSTYTAAEGDSVSITVTLDKQPERSVTILIDRTNQGTTTNGDYSVPTSVTFNSTETSKTITFTANDDTEDDDGESVLLGFGTLPTGVNEGTPSSTTVSITDDDVPQVVVTFGSSTYTAAEGDSVSITVTLDKQPERSVTIPIDRTNQGTTTNGDYSVPTSVTFNSTETSKTITFTANDDTEDDDGESVLLGFGTLPTGVNEGTPSSTTVSITDDDAPQVKVSFGQNSYTAPEGDDISITITLDKQPERSVTIPIDSTNQGTTTDADYMVPTSVTFQSSETSKTITFTANQDTEDDDGESVLLDFGTLPTGVTEGSPSSTTVSITDDDVPQVKVSFGSSTYTAAEGDSVSITVTLDKAPERSLTIPIDATEQGTTTNADYDVPTSVTFNSTETSKTITFTANQDTEDDDNESVLLDFGTLPTGVTEGTPSSTTVSITDDDHPQVEVSFGSSTYTADEGDSVSITVTLDKQPERTVTIPVRSTNQGTTSNGDYSVPTSVTFNSTETSKTITFTANQDTEDDDNESVLLDFGTLPTGVTEGTPSSTTVSITDDDVPQVKVSFGSSTYTAPEGDSVSITVTLDKAPERSLTIPIDPTNQGTTTDADYMVPTSVTFNSTETSKTITFTANQDAEDDDNESVLLDFGTLPTGVTEGTPSSTTVSITDDDVPQVVVTFGSSTYTAAEGETVSVVVELDKAPERTVTIPIAPTNQGTTSADYDVPTSVTFNSSETSKSITFTANDDNEDDDNESVLLDFGTLPTGVTEGSPSSTTVSITDDDHPQVKVSFGSSTYTAPEGDSVSITVTLDKAPERSLTIPIDPTNQGTTANADYDVPNSVTFGSSETSKTITFTANDDTEDDDGESVLLGFGTLPTGVNEGTPSSTTVSITDDDAPQVKVSFGQNSYTADEGDSVSITVTLDKQPERTVTIPVRSTNLGTTSNGDYSVPTSVTFNSSETSKTITFTANQDTEDDDNESVVLDFGTLPTGVTEGTPSSTTVSITDDDQTVVPTTDCEDGGVYCGVLDFRAVKDFAEGRKELERNSLDIDEFTYNGVTYGVGVVLLSPEPRGIVEPGPPFAIPERATLLLSLANLSPDDGADMFTMPNEDWKDWTLYVSTEVDGETIEAALRFNEAKFISGRKWRWYGLDLDALNAAWAEGRNYGLRIAEDLRADREPEVTGPPLYLESRGSNPDNVLLSWVKPQTRNDDPPPGVTYKVQWRTPGESSWNEYVYEPTPDEEWVTWTLRELQSGTSYEVRVIATNAAGDSEPSSVLTVTTKGEPSSSQQQTANTPATGVPGITGTASLDETLTADTSGIADEDGMTGAVFTYQWIRRDLATTTDTDIQGATGSTYTVTAEDEGHGIRVRVTFTDDAGNEESLTSITLLSAPPIIIPDDEDVSNTPATGAPTISGTAQVGQTLTADTSAIADDDGLTYADFAFQWLADDTDIPDATASTYTLSEADVGKTIKVRVTATDGEGNEASQTSEATKPVAPRANTPATGAPTISGSAQVGQTLTADTSAIADDDGLTSPTFAYRWLADDTAIPDATASTYTLSEDDVGKTIRVRVTFTDDAGNEESLTSDATEAVARPPLTATLHDTPDSHDGTNTFTFELRFSENIPISYRTLRDHAFTVTGGEVTQARRLDPSGDSRNLRWEITVRPDGNGAVTIVLTPTGDCNDDGAICTADNRKLSNRLELVVPRSSG